VEETSLWSTRRISRRAVLQRAAIGAAGAGAVLSLSACGGKKTPPAPVSNGQPLDSTKGKPGGTFVVQTSGYHGGLALVTRASAAGASVAGLAHSGLLRFRYGRPVVDPFDISTEPDLAQTLPEQPDELTYVYKLKQAQFQNGRPVGAEDVKYSYDRYAFADVSVRKANWDWLDQVQTPDAQTVVVKTKRPYADALQAMGASQDGFILAKEFEESPESPSKLMGSGPFVFESDLAPVSTTFRKNPNYFEKPYPYFDQVLVLGTSDPAKQVADFTAKHVHMTYWFSEEPRDQIKSSRPDAVAWSYPKPAVQLFMRTDKPPFNDKRVRQALSMTVDRKKIRQAVSKGEGDDDQILSIANRAFGFRKPSELGAAAKYWSYDPATAKQLLSAAGVTLPIEVNLNHWDAAVTGQAMVDHATLVQATWRELGIANAKDNTQSGAQYFSTTATGNYEGMGMVPGLQNVALGKNIKDNFYSPADGVVKVPTTNTGHVADTTLNALLDQQLGQLNVAERKKTLQAIEDLIAEEMYRVVFSTYTTTFFTDPSLRNLQVGYFSYGGSFNYMQFPWFA
jgi:ABC-type transport system substrate-binding protein